MVKVLKTSSRLVARTSLLLIQRVLASAYVYQTFRLASKCSILVGRQIPKDKVLKTSTRLVSEISLLFVQQVSAFSYTLEAPGDAKLAKL